jgi:hypothetical protein
MPYFLRALDADGRRIVLFNVAVIIAASVAGIGNCRGVL